MICGRKSWKTVFVLASRSFLFQSQEQSNSIRMQFLESEESDDLPNTTQQQTQQLVERFSMKSNSAAINPSPFLHRWKGVASGSLRRRSQFLIMAWAVTALSVGITQASNLFFNGTLDNTAVIATQPDGNLGQVNPCPVGWNVTALKTISGAFYDGGDSEPWCNVSPPSDPSGYGFFFKPFQGSTNANPALNDLLSVVLSQDNACTPGTKCSVAANLACEANCSLVTDASGQAKAYLFVEFLDNTHTILSLNKYDLVASGMPTSGTGGMATGPNPMTTPQYTAPAGTVTVRAGVWMTNVFGTTGAQSFFADNLDLETVAPPGSPSITSQPTSTTVNPGGTVSFTVVASGATSYQWQFYGTNLVNGGVYSGSTTATLTITGATAANVGHYRALVSNGSGSVFSSDAVLALMNLAINPVITLNGKVGDTYEIDYSTTISPPTWIPLSTNRLTTTTLTVVDPVDARGGSGRYYRAVFLY